MRPDPGSGSEICMVPRGKGRRARLLLHIAMAKARRATPAAPAPTATPALAATERPLAVGGVPAAAEDDEAAEDVSVPVLDSEAVPEAEEVSVAAVDDAVEDA